MCSGHPSNTRKEAVCMFYKDYVPVIRRDDLCAFTECIVTNIKLEKNQYFLLAVISINPSQNSRWIWKLLPKFSLHIIKIDHTSTFCSVVIGDFDFSCRNWLALDVNLNVGKELDSLTSTRGYDQLVDKLTPFLVADLQVLI